MEKKAEQKRRGQGDQRAGDGKCAARLPHRTVVTGEETGRDGHAAQEAERASDLLQKLLRVHHARLLPKNPKISDGARRICRCLAACGPIRKRHQCLPPTEMTRILGP